MSAAAGDGESVPIAPGSGRSGPMRAKVRRAVKEARDAGRMTAEHEVRALLADRYAELVDRAAKLDDGPGLLRAGEKLLEVLDTLPIRSTSGGGDSGDSTGDERGRVLQLMDGPPTVGDSAHS